MKRLIVIEGPTASGKTAVSVSLAKSLNTVIISADSRQFYKELSIGTAKPDQFEQQGVKHYFIDSHSIYDTITAAEYAKAAGFILDQEFQYHENVIMVGGSGMFIDAICLGLDDIPSSETIREELNQQWKTEGLDKLLQELKEKDPDYYGQVDSQNPMRIIRALEAIRVSGKSFSSLRKGIKQQKSYEIIRFIIQHDRSGLYNRINNRVDKMIANGLVDEARDVYNVRHLNALNTVGYKELFDYFDNKISLDEAINLIKQHTRNYAKRQITWFKKHEDAIILPFTHVEEMTAQIISTLLSRN